MGMGKGISLAWPSLHKRWQVTRISCHSPDPTDPNSLRSFMQKIIWVGTMPFSSPLNFSSGSMES